MGQLNVAVYEEVIAHRARRSDHMGHLITLLGGHKTLTEELKQSIATLEAIYNDVKHQWLEDKALGHRVCELSANLEGMYGWITEGQGDLMWEQVGLNVFVEQLYKFAGQIASAISLGKL